MENTIIPLIAIFLNWILIHSVSERADYIIILIESIIGVFWLTCAMISIQSTPVFILLGDIFCGLCIIVYTIELIKLNKEIKNVTAEN